MHAIEKYLRNFAEPEASAASVVPGAYERALVVPAYREAASLLNGYVTAASTSRGKTLCILVVNGPEDALPAARGDNVALVDSVRARLDGTARLRFPEPAFLGHLPHANLTVLILDRASEGFGLPPKEGVGLARKIGCDLALSLHALGRVHSPLIYSTDADATLPEGFFDADAAFERPESPRAGANLGAAIFPFWHDAAPHDAELTRATALYEIRLRYHVEGLAWAGSPYAFHTVGSAMAVSARAYAAVRGMPRRAAAEDFYLLNKIAKVLPIARVGTSPIRIQARASDRTPFGTGAAVRSALASPAFTLHAPELFGVLRGVLGALHAFPDHGETQRTLAELRLVEGEWGASFLPLLAQWGLTASLETIGRETKTALARRHRVDCWFDAFRTLKVLHAVRDSAFPDVPWSDALGASPFVVAQASIDPLRPAGAHDAERASHRDPALVTLRARLSMAERGRYPWVGPCVHAPPAP